MSDSDLSTPANIPADAEIEKAIRRVARDLLKTKPDNVTVNGVRKGAEAELGLDADFLRNDSDWKKRSKSIVEAVVNEEPSSPEKPKKSAPKHKAKPAAKAGTKRKSSETAKKPRKKARKHESEHEISDAVMDNSDEVEERPAKRSKKQDRDEDDFEEEEKPKGKKRAPAKRKPIKKGASNELVHSEASDVEIEKSTPADKSAHKIEARSDGEETTKPVVKSAKSESELSEAPRTEEEAPVTNGKATALEDDESDLSSLIDEPPKKKRQKKSSEAKPKSTSRAAPKPKGSKKTESNLSPDQEEVKRLQGWLVKCGIRKVWGKELAKCSTDKEKVKHLKALLEDAGMTGRYSNEKASQIKEARELAAELEATQDFADRWGKSDEETKGRPKGGKTKKAVQVSEDDDDEEADEGEELKPARRLPKGLVDFGDSGDEGSD